MSKVVFVTGSRHRLQMACRIAGRHYLAGNRLTVYAADQRRLAYFDQLLWRFETTAFVPHVDAQDALAERTPVILTHDFSRAIEMGHNWLLNLDIDVPPQADAFANIVEVVSGHEEDRAAARRRWLRYRDDGHTLSSSSFAAYLS
ncbi:MAG: DNA polymerase III subunit chi [Castellaniella sp.]